MAQKLVLPAQNSLVIVNAALDGQYVVSFDPIFLLKHSFHLLELSFVHNVDLKLYLKLKRVVGIVLYYPRLVVVDLFVGLIEEVVEFVSKLVRLLALLLGDVVAVAVVAFLVRLARSLPWDVEVARGLIDPDELLIGHGLGSLSRLLALLDGLWGNCLTVLRRDRVR